MPTGNAAGRLLRAWRLTRGVSQMDLALDAGISTRHLSFIETGRSRPSQEVILLLAQALDVPLRQRNGILEAAGFARVYPETGLDAPEMASVRQMLAQVLARQEPFGALVSDLHWNIVMANRVSAAMIGRLVHPDLLAMQPMNHLKLIFDPRGLRRHLVNWPEVAKALVGRIHREVLALPREHPAAALLAEVLSYPEVPKAWRTPDLAEPVAPLMTLHIRGEGMDLRLFTTVATLGTPHDVTLQELRIETFVPADAETEKAMQVLIAG
jgi:transcriptional regulator with XRE-family HTH domain